MPEQAVQRGFLEHVTLLEADRQLDRIVLDEAHTVVTERGFRPSMDRLQKLRKFVVSVCKSFGNVTSRDIGLAAKTDASR